MNEYEDLRKLEKRVKKLDHEYKNQHKYISSLIEGNNAFHKRVEKLEEAKIISAWYFQHIQDWKFKWFSWLKGKLEELEQKIDRGWDSDRKFVEYIEERLRAMELTHKDLRDKIEKLEQRVSPLEICINAHKDLYDNTRKIEKLETLFGVMKKTYNKSFKQIKELEQKLEGEPQKGSIEHLNKILEKKGYNAEFIKEEQEAIDIVEDYRKNREKYEGKEANRCDDCNLFNPNKKDCKVCNDPESAVDYHKKQEAPLDTIPIYSPDIYSKEEKGEAEPDKIAGVHQECPECGWKFYGYFRYGKQLIAEFIKTLKQEIEYCKTINYYTLFDGKSVQCIPIKTLEEQFNRLIEKLEGKLK